MVGVVPRPCLPQGGDAASSLVFAWVKGLPAPREGGPSHGGLHPVPGPVRLSLRTSGKINSRSFPAPSLL